MHDQNYSTTQGAMMDKYEARVEWCLAWEERKNLEKTRLQFRSLHSRTPRDIKRELTSASAMKDKHKLLEAWHGLAF
jgi:hypothetical protein